MKAMIKQNLYRAEQSDGAMWLVPFASLEDAKEHADDYAPQCHRAVSGELKFTAITMLACEVSHHQPVKSPSVPRGFLPDWSDPQYNNDGQGNWLI